MPELVFTPAANADLVAIALHIEEESANLETAERLVERIIAKCQALAGLSSVMGRPRPELLPDMRSVPFGNYLIFLRYTPSVEVRDRLEIVNILHASRDIGAVFAKRH